MLVAEALAFPADLSRRLKVFATDLDDAALETARRGQNGAEAVAHVPDHLCDRYLLASGPTWEVAPALREAVVFAHHDVVYDPPFPRLDLVSLRNTLIYFAAETQERVLRLCHFALMPGGVLFLGEAERTAVGDPLFTPVDSARHLYRRSDADGKALPAPRSALRNPPPLRIAPTASVLRPADDRNELFNDLLGGWAPPSLVVDEHDEVVEVIGDVTPWCWVAAGPYSTQVAALLREELQPAVRTLLLQLHHGEVPAASRRLPDRYGTVVVTARRLHGDHRGFAVVSFGAEHAAAPTTSDRDVVPERFDEQEVLAAQEALQSTIEDLSAANEEMQTLNEEL